MAFSLNINGRFYRVDVEEDMPLLWVLRDELGITSVKYGCGIAQCGACTVHMDGYAIRSCSITVGEVDGEITTIDGARNPTVERLKEAWIVHQVPQCGYCQAGQIMTAADLLEAVPKPTDEDIGAYMSENLCRCGTYVRIRAAIKTAAANLADDET